MDNKFTYQGQIINIKIIKAQNPTLVHIQMQLKKQELLNAIIAKNALTFILDVQINDTISIFGHYNHRKQFVVERYLNPRSEINRQCKDWPNHLYYPKRKED